MRLVVDLTTAFFALALATSILCGFGAWLLRPVIESLSPTWRARIWYRALLAPLAVGVLGLVIALLPSLWHVVGLASDHCAAVRLHVHPHLCFVHGPAQGSHVLDVIASIAVAFVVVRILGEVARTWRTRRMFMSMIATSELSRLDDRTILVSSDVPLCATAGVWHPTIFISSGARAALGPECAAAALAHEHGHVARHETRLRLLGCVAATLHVPWLGRAFLTLWQRDSEFVCDLYAARRAQSGCLVAEALVRFQRALLDIGTSPTWNAACFCTEDAPLTARVRSLLAVDIESANEIDERGGMAAYWSGLALLLIGVVLQARHLHHGLESFVGFLSSALS